MNEIQNENEYESIYDNIVLVMLFVLFENMWVKKCVEICVMLFKN